MFPERFARKREGKYTGQIRSDSSLQNSLKISRKNQGTVFSLSQRALFKYTFINTGKHLTNYVRKVPISINGYVCKVFDFNQQKECHICQPKPEPTTTPEYPARNKTWIDN